MKMPRRTAEIEMDGEYEGFKFTALISAPTSIFSYLNTANWDLIQAAAKHVVLSWNFVDEEGNPLPQPQEMVPALDVNGDPVVIPVSPSDNGQAVEQPILIPAVALVPLDLCVSMLRKVAEKAGQISPS